MGPIPTQGSLEAINELMGSRVSEFIDSCARHERIFGCVAVGLEPNMSEGGQVTLPTPMTRLNAQQLRTASESEAAEATLKDRNPLYLILENVYDTYNIGGLFRLADGLNVQKMYLCGEMERPPHTRIEKASIGTYKIVPWAYFPTVKEAIEDIQASLNVERGTQNSLQVVAVEQDAHSVPYTQIQYAPPTALIVGNETYGVLPETLKLATHIAEIPMWGVNKSLNVIVSGAIVSFEVMRQQKTTSQARKAGSQTA